MPLRVRVFIGANERVQPEPILVSHRTGVLEQTKAAVILTMQDTTDLNFSGLKQTRGLGLIKQSQQQGSTVHRCFAVSGSGTPLGLLQQHT